VTDDYRLAIKPSAWQRSRPVGRWVNEEGSRRTFSSKALAKEWSRECAGHGVTLWVQDALPWDERPVDGYLVGGTRSTPRQSDATATQQSLDLGTENPD
jgi:hypothetical protein